MDVGSLIIAAGLVAAGYFIGGIPFGIVISRLVGGPDPRTVGSGRTGGANVMRSLGLRVALVAGLLDAAKGSVSVILASVLGSALGVTEPAVQVLAGLASIVGHSRSPYIGLRGGRGVAPAWGALLVIQPVVALAIVPVFLGVLVVTRISSIASLATSVVGAIGLIAAVVALEMPPVFVVYGVGAAVIVWLFHIDNLQRLIAGEERRITFRGRGGGDGGGDG